MYAWAVVNTSMALINSYAIARAIAHVGELTRATILGTLCRWAMSSIYKLVPFDSNVGRQDCISKTRPDRIKSNMSRTPKIEKRKQIYIQRAYRRRKII